MLFACEETRKSCEEQCSDLARGEVRKERERREKSKTPEMEVGEVLNLKKSIQEGILDEVYKLFFLAVDDVFHDDAYSDYKQLPALLIKATEGKANFHDEWMGPEAKQMLPELIIRLGGMRGTGRKRGYGKRI